MGVEDENEEVQPEAQPTDSVNPAPAAGGFVLGPGPMGITMPSTTTGTTTTKQTEDADTLALKEDYAKAGMAGSQATMAEAESKAIAQEKANALAEAETEEIRRYNIDRQAAAYDLQQRIDTARQTHLDRVQRAAAEPTKFWDDRTAGDRTQARIGVLLGVLGGAMNGTGKNTAQEYLDKQIELDTRNKAVRAERLMKLADQSSGVLSDASRARAEELGDMDAQRTAAHAVIASQIQNLINAGMPDQMRQQALQLKAKWDQTTAEKLQAGADKVAGQVVSENKKTEAVNAASQPVAVRGAKGEVLGYKPAHAAAGIQADLALRDEAVGLAQQLQKMEGEGGLAGVINRTAPTGESARKREQLTNQLLAVSKKIEGSAIGRGIDKNLLGGITGATAGSHLTSRAPELQSYIESLNAGATRLLRMQGMNAKPQLGATKQPTQKAAAPAATPAQQLDLINSRYQAAKKVGDKAGMARAAKLLDLHTQAYGGGQ
jgi:hypothetical protein